MLTETYRPMTWGTVIAQDKAVGQLLKLRDRTGLAGRAYWITGQSGTGKTTIGRLIAAEVADKWYTNEHDAGSLTVSDLKLLEVEMRYYSMGKGGRAYIVNEAHGLRVDVIRHLLVMLEAIPSHCVWIFTTTCSGQEELFADHEDTGPLLSRCIEIPLARRDLTKPFAAELKRIAIDAGLAGPELKLERCIRLLRDCNNNMRRALQVADKGELL